MKARRYFARMLPMMAIFIQFSACDFSLFGPRSNPNDYGSPQYKNNVYGKLPVTMITVPAGSFNNGFSTVTLTAFEMSVTEITQGQYEAVMGIRPSQFTSGSEALYRPVEQVSWYDALVFCNKLSLNAGLTPVYSISGSTNPENWGNVPSGVNNSAWDGVVMNMGANGYRLPTEAEWEYAARGGSPVDSYTFAGSDTIGAVAWYWDNCGAKTHVVGEKTANSLGLYDMTGNVNEWCWDWHDTYSTLDQTNPTGPTTGSLRVARGGSWSFSDSSFLQVSYRGYSFPFNRSFDYGIRVVRRP